MDAMPSKPSRSVTKRKQCVFKEGTLRCTSTGTGSPALCEGHRAALHHQPGVAEQLGGILDQVLHGQAPSPSQIEQTMANLAGALLGRTVTIEEVHTIRTGVRQGRYEEMVERWQIYQQEVRGRVSQVRERVIDPDMAKKIEHAKACGRARAVMGFTAQEPLTVDIIKARHRELARKHHPDKGGDTVKMQRINGSADILLGSL